MAKKINMRRINIALVGCGRISKNHIKSINIYSDRTNLVAICDTNAKRLEEAKLLAREELNEAKALERKNPECYTSYDKLLESIDKKLINIDLIVLTTPSGMHAKQVIAAAGKGISVCTEKPMATKWEDGLKMVEACKKNDVHLFVVKQNRFNSTLQLVKKQLAKKRFGKLAMVTVNVFWHRPQSYYDQDDWRGTWEFDGGALMNQASHYVDLLDWLIGPVASVSASIATLGRKIEVEDTAAMQLRWKSGTLGTMAVTMLTYPENLEGSITLLGDKGTVKIGGQAVNQIEHWEFSDNSDDDKLIDKASYLTTSVYGFGHPGYYKNMLDVMEGKDVALCDGNEGLRSLEILIASYKSAQEKRIIDLPLENN